MKTFTGGCHCGDVRYQVDADLERASSEGKLLDCNCSMCAKKGIVHLMVPRADFRLLTSTDAITFTRFASTTRALAG